MVEGRIDEDGGMVPSRPRSRLGLDQIVGGLAVACLAWAVIGGWRGVHRGDSDQLGALTPSSVVGEGDVPVATPRASSTVADPAQTVPGTASEQAAVPSMATAGQPSAFTAAFVGDVLPHMPMLRRIIAKRGSINFTGALNEVRPLLSSVDLAVCHLEGAMIARGAALRTNPRLGVPPAMLDEVARVGFDRCSTASNHALDGGVEGVRETVRAFAERKLGQSGMAVSEETRLPAVVTINGIKVAHLSYTYGFDVGVRPAGERWWSNLIDPQLIIDDAQEMRRRGADVVIVSAHWGNTQWDKVSPEQRTWAEEITASGQVDLIVGHHSHLLQPIEQINGRWVIFGMSNFLSDMPVNQNWVPQTQDGAVFTVTLQRTAEGRIEVGRPAVYPTWCDKLDNSKVRFSGPKARDDDVSVATAKGLDVSFRRVSKIYGDLVVDANR